MSGDNLFMKWIDVLDKIYLINLTKREDRLLQATQDFEEYQIPFSRVTAIEDTEQGARGLRDTMLLIFKEAVEKNYQNILIFEDDVKFVVEPFWFHDTMDRVVAQLPEHYHLCFLGGQASHRFSRFQSPNLLPVIKYFSTHAVMYSLQGMKEILARNLGYPIDNWYVDEIQPMNNCYCVHPLLCSQYAGHSDIGHNFIDWHPFIVPRHAQKIAEMGGSQW
jgi:GR25 family glycosyltransferase involved in LPS biosynthesis